MLVKNILSRIAFGSRVAFHVSIVMFLTLFVAATLLNIITGFHMYVLFTNIIILFFASPLLIGWAKGLKQPQG